MKKCIATSLFIPSNVSNKYSDTYLSIPKTMYLLDSDFDLLIYYDDSVPKYMIESLKQYSFVKLYKEDRSIGRSGCFWRYQSYDLYDIVLFRDIDIAIEYNDVIVYNNFIANTKNNIAWIFLVHPRRPYPKQGFVMGGVFMIKKNPIIPSMKMLLDDWPNKSHYGSDEEFLSIKLYPLLNPVCYYEPRDNCKNTVIINREFETYIMLKDNYKLTKYSNS
jgi:hypothetical protein